MQLETNSTFQYNEENISSLNKREYLLNIPAKYIELLEIAYDGKRNRDFEIVTAELFKNY